MELRQSYNAMNEVGEQSGAWTSGDLMESTEPGVSVSVVAEELPTLTVATIIGVTVVVLITIALVFFLGVLIDCRQQKLLEKKMGQVKKQKNHRRGHPHPESDAVSIANNMESPGLSLPPAVVLHNIS